MNNVIISTHGLKKYYFVGESTVKALDGVDMTVNKGESVCIAGRSGSGKSTMLNMLAGLELPTSGTVQVASKRLESMNEKARIRFRRDDIGFVFQSFNLLGKLTALENVKLPLSYAGVRLKEADARARKQLALVGLEGREHHLPNQLSGGQQQRVAIARALVCEPEIILADEPTGALDSKSARQLLESLAHLNERGSTILMVTHDSFSASYCNRIVFIKDGGLYGELRRNGTERSAFYRRIVDVVSSMGGAGEDDAADEVTRHAC